MIVRVLFFAYLRERCGVRETSVEIRPGASVGDLWDALRARYPALEGQRLRFAVNQEYVDNAHTLDDNDELALIPPVSGGFSETDREAGRNCQGPPARRGINVRS